MALGLGVNPAVDARFSLQAARDAAGDCNRLENYDEAVEWACKAIDARTDRLWPHLNLAVALAGQDRLDEARVAIEAARRVKPDLSLSINVKSP